MTAQTTHVCFCIAGIAVNVLAAHHRGLMHMSVCSAAPAQESYAVIPNPSRLHASERFFHTSSFSLMAYNDTRPGRQP